MILFSLEAEGLQWRATLRTSPAGSLSLGLCSLDLIEKASRRFYAAEGVSWEGSEAAEAIEDAREVEASERRSRFAERLSRRRSCGEVDLLGRIHHAAHRPGVFRG